jgi:dihydrofolate reductase
MLISLVVAASENNAIGKNNQLLWRLPNDMKFFKNTTWPLPIVMGRKTFESIGSKPLPGRRNIVVTRQKNWKAYNVSTASDISNAIEIGKKDDVKEVFIIGGGEIFRETMSMAGRKYMTRVQANLVVFFPPIDPSKWKLQSSVDHPADAKHAYPYTFEIWEKISPQ